MDARQRTHLSGVVAGSLLVVSLYLVVAVPAQVARTLASPTWPSVLFLLLVVALVAGGALAAKGWHEGDKALP